jgi:hypothetical protein
LLKPNGKSWEGTWTKDESARTFFNVRNFIRSLYLQVVIEDALPLQEELEIMLLDAVQRLRAY